MGLSAGTAGVRPRESAVKASNLAPLPDDVEFKVGANMPISGMTAWQGLFEHGGRGCSRAGFGDRGELAKSSASAGSEDRRSHIPQRYETYKYILLENFVPHCDK